MLSAAHDAMLSIVQAPRLPFESTGTESKTTYSTFEVHDGFLRRPGRIGDGRGERAGAANRPDAGPGRRLGSGRRPPAGTAHDLGRRASGKAVCLGLGRC